MRLKNDQPLPTIDSRRSGWDSCSCRTSLRKTGSELSRRWSASSSRRPLFAHDQATGTRQDVVAQREFLEDLTEAVGKALQNGDMMLQTLSLPKYKDWAHYDDWLGMNGARILMEMMMGY